MESELYSVLNSLVFIIRRISDIDFPRIRGSLRFREAERRRRLGAGNRSILFSDRTGRRSIFGYTSILFRSPGPPLGLPGWRGGLPERLVLVVAVVGPERRNDSILSTGGSAAFDRFRVRRPDLLFFTPNSLFRLCILYYLSTENTSHRTSPSRQSNGNRRS